MSFELPKDAEGREIPLDTKVLYQVDGSECTVVKWEWEFYPHNIAPEWTVVLKHKGIREAFNPKFMHLTPRDSWEKLLEDLDRGANALPPSGVCAYSNKDGGVCADCLTNDGTSCDQAVLRDIASRIRTLRGEDA